MEESAHPRVPSDYAIVSLAPDGTIETWSAGAESVFGYARPDVVGRNFNLLFSADDRRAGIPAGALLRATLDGSADGERWLVRKNGSRFLAGGTVSGFAFDAGARRGFVAVAHDLTKYQAAAEVLRRRADHDQLTALPNRRMFDQHVTRAFALMRRKSTLLFAVLFIDVDHFKAVNDEFGHIAADGLLVTIARKLESCVRSEDIVSRVGGDEFAILINGIGDVADARDAARRIIVDMDEPVVVEGRAVRATVSVGIAMATAEHAQPDDILRDADRAMYAAKGQGRARSVVFDSATASGSSSAEFARQLKDSLERDDLRLAYQPIVRLASSSVMGFEALVRWQHPRRGLLLPADFIARAEQSDLIFAIDRWVLRRACEQLAYWHREGIFDDRVQMSVNVSSREFSRDAFLDDLRATLAATGVSPRQLRLEITETIAMERSDRVTALLDAIRTFGVELDFDDFGTGFSSLGALQHIAVDALKIDASFVAGMHSEKGARLVESVLILAHRLGIVTIAEGIETEAQLRRLAELGCDYGQGYFLSAPLDAQAAARYRAPHVLPPRAAA